jgi:excinuclease UvrABC nuclease subunit
MSLFTTYKKNEMIRNINNITPEKLYSNLEECKRVIYKENKRKSGIYRWTNLVTGKSYIGSAVNLTERLKQYFSPKYLDRVLSRSRSLICSSLLKYGYANFNLEILEYCNKNILLFTEQQYIDTVKPKYNICKIAGSTYGKKHSAETITKIKLNSRGILIIVVNTNNNSINEYSSVNKAANSLGVCAKTIHNYANTDKILKNIYLIRKTNEKSI